MPRPSGHRLVKAVGAVVAAGALLALPAVASAAPTGLFVGDYAESGNTISQFTIGAGGLLSPNGTVATGGQSWLLAATPNGKYLYGTNIYDGTVSEYSIGSGGTLTPLSPATVSTGSGSAPQQLAVSPDGKNLYVASGTAALDVYSIGSGGVLSLIQSVPTAVSGADGVVVSPDGSSVYVGNYDEAGITEFNRSSNGMLAPKPVSTVAEPLGDDIALVMTPNGKYLYASGDSTPTIAGYSVGSGGELTPLASTGTGAVDNDQLTVSPNGRNLYMSSCTTNAPGVYQFSISSTGELAPLSPAVVATAGGCPYEQWMSASGKALYAPDYVESGDVSQFSVSSTGALTPDSPASEPAGYYSDDVVIPPDQGPVARFTTKSKGRKVLFNASESSDSDGKVVSYHWNFGDGHSLTTSKAAISHTYKKAGKHKATLTVTDDSGCSTTQVFTGQTAYCNGTTAAMTSHTIKLAAAKSLKLRVTPDRAKAGQRTCYAFTASSTTHRVKGVTVRLAGRSTHTGRAGTATLCLTLKKGSSTARASKSGYRSAAARIRVSAAGPVFTG